MQCSTTALEMRDAYSLRPQGHVAELRKEARDKATAERLRREEAKKRKEQNRKKSAIVQKVRRAACAHAAYALTHSSSRPGIDHEHGQTQEDEQKAGEALGHRCRLMPV
jgi:hypothetical protein